MHLIYALAGVSHIKLSIFIWKLTLPNLNPVIINSEISVIKSSKKDCKGNGFEVPQNIPTAKGLLTKLLLEILHKIGQNWILVLLNKGIPSTLKLNLMVLFANVGESWHSKIWAIQSVHIAQMSKPLHCNYEEFLIIFENPMAGLDDKDVKCVIIL